MKIDEAESGLGLRKGELRKRLSQAYPWPEGTRAFNISEPGPGAMFRPQKETTLWFDAQDRLRRVWINVVYWTDEEGREMTLAD